MLITERGVAGLRIQEITERADVALGSFYNHFSTKEELVEAVVTESLTDLAATASTPSAPDSDPAEAVAISCFRFIRLAYEEPDFAQLLVNLSSADALFDTTIHPYARAALERGIDSGRFVIPDLEVTLTAVISSALALIRQILAAHHEAGSEYAYTRHVLASLGLTPADAEAVTAAARLT